MWTNLCLFCQGPDSSVWGNGHIGEAAGIKREPGTFTGIFDKEDGQGQSDDGCLEGQLKAVFILREVLNVERGRLEEYLGGGDGGNPGEWFGVCSKCGEIVEECWRIWREIGKWRRKLEGKKRELRGKVEETGRRLEGDLGEMLGNLRGAADQVLELDEKTTCQQFLCSDDDEDEAGSGFDNEGYSSSDEHQDMSRVPTPENGVTSTDSSTVFRKKYRCPKCIASYAKLRFLTDHLKIHKLSPKEIECCDRCGWAYKAPIYVLHRSEQCPFPNKLYQCSQCPAAYPFKGRYEKHLWLHQNKELGKAKECPKCGWLFSRKIDKFHVATHQNTDFGVSHESWKERRYVPKLMKEEIPWYCDFCHLIFPTRAKLARHVLQGHPTEKLVECELCLPNVLRFESQKLVQLHKKEVHGFGGECKEERETLEGDEGQCPHCEKSFTTKSKRDYHLAKEHMKEQLICPICKKYRAREYHRLRIHMKTHEVSGVLTCEVCSKKIRRSLLPKHMMQMHCGRKRSRIKKQKSKKVVQVISTTPVSIAEQDNCLSAENDHRVSPSPLGIEDKSLDDDELPVVEIETDDRLSDPDWEPTLPPVESDLLSPVFEEIPEKMALNTPTTESFEDDLRAAETQLAEIVSQASRREFQCIHCIASYDNRTKLRDHLLLHQLPKESTFPCDKCGWVYRNYVPAKHSKHCPASDFKFHCKRCDLQFHQKTGFLKHLDLHSRKKEDVAYCLKCDWQGPWRLLHRHKKQFHGQVKTKKSGTEIQRNKVKNAEKLDEEENPEEIPFYCDHCHLIFPGRRSLIKHYRASHKNVDLLECDLCQDTKMESKQLLKIHRQLVHNLDHEEEEGAEVNRKPQVENMNCPHCSEQFETKGKRDFHIAKKHKKEQLICPICKEYQAKEMNLLRNHMRRHDKNHTVMCEICSKVVRSASLGHHRQLFHYKELGLEPIQCDQCGVHFGSWSNLKNHQDFVHSQKIASCCPLCTKTFRSKNDLNRHIKAHEDPDNRRKDRKGLNAFKCQKCPSQFNTRPGLYYHMKREHSNQYPYRCDQCGKGYCSENTLMDHQQRLCKKGKMMNTSIDFEKL